MKNLFMVAILLLVVVGPAQAAEITYTWTGPTGGTPVEYYQVQKETDGSWVDVDTSPVESITLELHIGVLVVRVCGVDEFGGQGPWSVPSVEQEYNGPPGGCSIMTKQPRARLE